MRSQINDAFHSKLSTEPSQICELLVHWGHGTTKVCGVLIAEGENSCFYISQMYNLPKYPKVAYYITLLFTVMVHYPQKQSHFLLRWSFQGTTFSLLCAYLWIFNLRLEKVTLASGYQFLQIYGSNLSWSSVKRRIASTVFLSIPTGAFPNHHLFPSYIPLRHDLTTSLPIS